jgi:beta-glucanase (GH16 family)
MCKVNDEFGGTFGNGQGNTYIDGNKWTFQNLSVNNEAEAYTTRQCADPNHTGDWNYCINNGALTIKARQNAIDCTNNSDCATYWNGSMGAKSYTSGRLISKHKVAMQYGYVEFRARLPFQNGQRKSGAWPAIWFLADGLNEGPPPGSTPWPWAPEHDLMEWQSPNGKMASNEIFIGNDGNMDACNNWPEGGSTECWNQVNAQTSGKGIWKVNDWSGAGNQGANGDAGTGYMGWHTYGLEWTPTKMRPWVDGVTQGYANITGGASEFNTPMFMIMNLALGGDLGSTIDGTIDWNYMTLDVDYMRWYQIGGADTCADPSGGGSTGTCSDGIRNQNESGVDCGGVCAACATCNDGIQNQGESSVDCGGPCAPCATQATFYWDCNYGGTSVAKAPGDYTTANMGMADNQISSIKVAPGYQVVIYQTDGFAGYSTVLTGNTACLVDTGAGRASGNWNDDTSSFRVQAIDTSTPPQIGVGSTVKAADGTQYGTQLEYAPGNGSTETTVGYFDGPNDFVKFSNVNLTGVAGLNMRIAGDASTTGKQMEVRADSATGGTLLGTYTMASTGGWQTWADRNVSFTTTMSGSHDLYLRGLTNATGILNIDTVTLTTKSASCTDGVQNQGETGVDCGGPCPACGGGSSTFTITASAYTNSGRLNTDGTIIEAEAWSGTSGVGTESCSEGGLDAMDIGNGEYTWYNNVNLQGVTRFDVRVASANLTGNIEFHIGSPTGTLIANCFAPYTGGWQTWTTVSCLASRYDGTANLYLVYVGAGNGNQQPNVNWFKPVVGVQLESCSEGGQDVMDAGCDEWASYNNVNFANLGSFEVRAASGNTYNTNLEFHRDSASGPLMATCVLDQHGGWQAWNNYTCGLTSSQTGTGTLYAVWKGTCQASGVAPNNNGLHNVRTIKGVQGAVACQDSCSAHGASCGTVNSNCGGTLSCGTCTAGYTCTANACVPPSSSNNPGSKDPTVGATYTAPYSSETGGVILQGGGASVCWASVNMGGNTKVTVNYGNGEPVGDSVKVTFNGAQVGGNINMANTGGFSVYQDGQTTFGALSGSGTLCVVGNSPSDNWVAKIHSVSYQ